MSFAQVTISGRVGKDAEVKQTASGSWMARFNVAANKSVKNQSGEYEDVTTWYQVSYFARSDKWLAQFTKGASVYVTGELYSRSYTNKDGMPATSLQVDAAHAESMTPRQQGEYQAPRQQAAPQAAPAGGDPWADDIPFDRVSGPW